MEQKGNIGKSRPADQRWRRTRRPCLLCGQGFRPGGPFIRICLPCKESEEWQSGNCDFVLSPPANDNAPEG
jgi:hypothetical protein